MARSWLRLICGRPDTGEPSCIAFGGLRADDLIETALLTIVSTR